jgi:hypothetical protein
MPSFFFVFLPKDLKEKVGRLNLLFSWADGVRFWASFKQIVGAGNKPFHGTLSQHGFFDWSFCFSQKCGKRLYLVQRVFSFGRWWLERCGAVSSVLGLWMHLQYATHLQLLSFLS